MGVLPNVLKSRECETLAPLRKGLPSSLNRKAASLSALSPFSFQNESLVSVLTQKWGFVAMKRFRCGRGSGPSRAGSQLSMVTPNFPAPHLLLLHRDPNPTSAVTLKRLPVRLSERIFLKQIFANVYSPLQGNEQRKGSSLLISLPLPSQPSLPPCADEDRLQTRLRCWSPPVPELTLASMGSNR